MAPVNPESGQTSILKEVVDLQSSMYDKASTYTKIIIGLGYGGFFTAWSGSKEHLSPKILAGGAAFEAVLNFRVGGWHTLPAFFGRYFCAIG